MRGERLERRLLGERRHRLGDALLRLGATLARDEQVLLALASSILSFRSRSEFLSFSVSRRCCSHVCSSCWPVRQMLALAEDRLLGEIVAPVP
jgi:hypothetical protein